MSGRRPFGRRPGGRPACRRILVYGYGNPGRQDDGLGPALADRIEAGKPAGVSVDAAYQLAIEDAADIAGYDVVVFVDADMEGPEPYSMRRLEPSASITFTSHLIGPESVLALCGQMYGKTPECWLLGIRGHAYDFGEELTEKARENLEEAFAYLIDFIEQLRDADRPRDQEGEENEQDGTQDDPDH